MDQAIQLHIDTKRNPDHIRQFANKLTPNQKRILELSQNLPPKALKVANKIEQSFRELGLEALDAEIINNVLDNYTGRIWDIEGKFTTGGRKFGVTTGHSKARKFETILEGMANGFNLKITGATNSLESLKGQIINTIEDKRFLKALKKIKDIDGKPLLSNRQEEGYVKVEHPNFKEWKFVGKGKEVSASGKNFFSDKDGNVFQRQELYAPASQAKNLNNILGVSKLKGIKAIDTITKWNAITKAWILQSSLFHHLAFMRSYYLGTNHKKFSEMSIRQAYRAGLKAIEQQDPIIMLGVRNGLTLGIRQDWEEQMLQEKTIIGKILDKTKATKVVKDKILQLRQRQADFLFGDLGAGLKAKSFLIEYRIFPRNINIYLPKK